MKQQELGPVALSGEPAHSDDHAETVGVEDAAAAEPDVVIEDLLVEDISIDGMCGVY